MSEASRRADARDVAVVVVNYRTPDLTIACLESVLETSEREPELIVVDNASDDGSADRIRQAVSRARVLEQESNGGFAAGVNAGVAATTAELVLLLNPDTTVEPGAIDALVARLRDHDRTGVVAPVLRYPDGSTQNNAYRRFPNLVTLFVDFCLPVGTILGRTPVHPHNVSAERLARGGVVAHVYGAALMFRRRAYEEAGPFDEEFFLYLEETEWQERVRAAGWAIEVEPRAAVIHEVRGGEPEGISPHYLPSAYRYLLQRGAPAPAIRAALGLAGAVTVATILPLRIADPRRAPKLRVLEANGRAALRFARRPVQPHAADRAASSSKPS